MMEWKKFQPADFTDHVNCARLISAGLSTQLLSRWIKHPQALTDIGHRRPKFPTLSRSADDFNKHVVFGGMGREPKKTPPSVPSYVGHCFAATRSTLSKDMDKVFNMIYTFIIAQPWQKIAQLKRVRTVSAYGRTEAEARRAFKGLPLVLKSRTPDNQEDAA
ncbi:hypothetical protein [Idiomarina sp.]|uniref:hypothetical protein n=1 Tax=Idiomarina sp. TaxID=1874361 RepID=UPI001D75F042|nr:hypothetical protein [Idiomarina sp.]MCJ8316996.1 hypothetical protein [Idiomarina sp.]NQZ17383.1 hypothetical protein [Idiomarina sp.]